MRKPLEKSNIKQRIPEFAPRMFDHRANYLERNSLHQAIYQRGQHNQDYYGYETRQPFRCGLGNAEGIYEPIA